MLSISKVSWSKRRFGFFVADDAIPGPAPGLTAPIEMAVDDRRYRSYTTIQDSPAGLLYARCRGAALNGPSSFRSRPSKSLVLRGDRGDDDEAMHARGRGQACVVDMLIAGPRALRPRPLRRGGSIGRIRPSKAPKIAVTDAASATAAAGFVFLSFGDLSHRQRADRQIGIVGAAQLGGDILVRRCLAEFTQNIGVEQINKTPLYRVVDEHLDDFLTRANDAGGVPGFVEEALRKYLACGVLRHSLCRFRCGACPPRTCISMLTSLLWTVCSQLLMAAESSSISCPLPAIVRSLSF